jgi:hypothetical protein
MWPSIAALWLLFCAACIVGCHYLDPHRDRG